MFAVTRLCIPVRRRHCSVGAESSSAREGSGRVTISGNRAFAAGRWYGSQCTTAVEWALRELAKLHPTLGRIQLAQW